MKMRRYLLGAGLLVSIGMGAACKHQGQYEAERHAGKEIGKAVSDKVHFADQLSLFDKKEVALGELALRKSSDTQVRAFAHELIENHQQQQASLESYANASALRLAVIDLAVEPGVGGSGDMGRLGARESVEKESKKYEKKLDKQISSFKEKERELSAMSGREFDKAFLEQVEKDQKRGRELVDHGLKEYGDDAGLAMVLGRAAPILERQYEHAKALRESIR